jgi:hypothetical protein
MATVEGGSDSCRGAASAGVAGARRRRPVPVPAAVRTGASCASACAPPGSSIVQGGRTALEHRIETPARVRCRGGLPRPELPAATLGARHAVHSTLCILPHVGTAPGRPATLEHPTGRSVVVYRIRSLGGIRKTHLEAPPSCKRHRASMDPLCGAGVKACPAFFSTGSSAGLGTRSVRGSPTPAFAASADIQAASSLAARRAVRDGGGRCPGGLSTTPAAWVP